MKTLLRSTFNLLSKTSLDLLCCLECVVCAGNVDIRLMDDGLLKTVQNDIMKSVLTVRMANC